MFSDQLLPEQLGLVLLRLSDLLHGSAELLSLPHPSLSSLNQLQTHSDRAHTHPHVHAEAD